mgnify:CR=1 FL=1
MHSVTARISDLLAHGPRRYRDLCAALAPTSDGSIARTLSQMESDGLVRRHGAVWERVSSAAMAVTNGSSNGHATPTRRGFACAACSFVGRTKAGLGVHVTRSHAQNARAGRAAATQERPTVQAPAHDPAVPQRPADPLLDRLRQVRESVTQAITGLEALQEHGFSF